MIIGGDEVFNYTQNHASGYVPSLYGHGIDAPIVASYAASAGYPNWQDVAADGIAEELGSGLRKMQHISVRDENTRMLVEQCIGRSPTLVVDPTFIYDFTNDIAKEAVLKPGYLLVYAYEGRMETFAEVEAIQTFARKENLRIVSPGFYHDWCDENIVVTPFELLRVFADAAYVVTDTFHGSIFAMLARRKLATLIRDNSRLGSNANKVRCLLEQFGMESRILGDIRDMPRVLNEPAPYDEFVRRQAAWKQSSTSYLQRVLAISAMSYKTLILKATPSFLHVLVRDVYFTLRMLPNYLYDFKRFLVCSGLNKSRNVQAERAARIVFFYHQVEKGLNLAKPRPGFGMPVISRVLDDVEAHVATYGPIVPATTAMAALQSYVDFNKLHGVPADMVSLRLEEIKRSHGIAPVISGTWIGGTRKVDRASIAAVREGTFSAFFESRHSVRQFLGGPISDNDLHKAVALAWKTPSVCNRQSWRVHAFSNPMDARRLLDIQSSSRGLSENVSCLLVITVMLANFLEVAERYQAWIDGGMFSMSLCLAFHEQGYGTSCLNWTKERGPDRAMHSAASIPQSEQIIMFLSVGNMPDTFEVARSYGPPVDYCLHIH